MSSRTTPPPRTPHHRGSAPKRPDAILDAARRGGGSGGSGGGRNFKRIIWTGAFAAIAFTGAIYGAGLKTQQEYKAERQQVLEMSAEDRIAELNQQRSRLVSQRIPLERKIADVRARMKEKELEEAGKNEGER